MKENGAYISGPDLGRKVELTQPVDRGYSIVEREIMPDGPPSIEGPKPAGKSVKPLVIGAVASVAGHEFGKSLYERNHRPDGASVEAGLEDKVARDIRIEGSLRRWAKNALSRSKDIFKKEEVEAELADEVKKEEDKLKTPRPGVGMPEPEIEVDLGTGDPTAVATPEAGAAGGGDGGSEPPDDRASTDGDSGEDASGGGGEPPDDGEPSSGKDDGDKHESDEKSEKEPYKKVEVPKKEDFSFDNLRNAAEKIHRFNERYDKLRKGVKGEKKFTLEEANAFFDFINDVEYEGTEDPELKPKLKAEFDSQIKVLEDTLTRIKESMSSRTEDVVEPPKADKERVNKYDGMIPEAVRLIDEGTDFEALNELLDEIDLSGNEIQYSGFIKAVALASTKTQREEVEKGGEYKETYGYAVEYLVERLLSISDSNPEGRYHQFNFTQQQNLDSLIESVRDYDVWHYNYLKKLQTTRYVGHEMFRTRKDWKNQSEIIASYLNKRGLSFIEHDIVGTDRVQQIYEQVFGDKVQSAKKWLLEDDLVEADKSARIIFGQDQHMIKKTIRYGVPNPETGEWDAEVATRKVRSEAGEEIEQPLQRGMQDFEISRGYLMGRSVMTGVQRRLVYQMIGDRPPYQEGVTSLESDSIAARLAPLKFTAFRYFTGPGPVRYLRNWRDRKVKEATWNGKTYGVKVSLPEELADLGLNQEKEWGQYGASIDSTILRDTGNQDPQSNGWRGFFMLLDHKAYKTATIGGEQLTIGEYLRRKKIEVMEDPLGDTHYHAPDYASLGKIGDHDPSMDLDHRKGALAVFNERIADTIGEQRLFLGALMRDGNLSQDNKAKIWENVSELLPSRIAAILPEHRKAIIKSVYGTDLSPEQVEAQWDIVKKQVWRMERTRVYEDAELIKNGEAPTKTLEDYFSLMDEPLESDASAISSEEQVRVRSVINKLQVLGVHNAQNLARMISPSTAFLDDVPDRGWQELGSTDLDRLFLGDQDNFEQGYNHIMGMLANPTISPDKADEGFHEFFEKIQVTLGPSSTQELVEPFIVAYYEMAKIYQKAKFLPGMGFFRKPRSQMEEVNMSSGIALYPDDIAAHLTHLAQMEVISDDPAHAIPIEELRGKSIPGRRTLQQVVARTSKLTQLQKLKYEMHASGEDIGREKARIMSLTFGALLILEMIIASLPDDAGSKLR